jgi:hypothetical protein
MCFKIHCIGDIDEKLALVFASEIYSQMLQHSPHKIHDTRGEFELMVFHKHFDDGSNIVQKCYYHHRGGLIENMSDMWNNFLVSPKHIKFEFL